MSQNGRVGHSVTFLKRWAQCHNMEELGTVSQNGRVRHTVTKWNSRAQCHKIEEMGTLHNGKVY